MGKMEQDSAKRSRKKKLQYAVLMSVAASGFLAMAVMAPNALQCLSRLGILDLGPRKRELINRARDRLMKRGLLNRDERGYLSMTPAGERELEMWQIQSRAKPKKWDKKWRVLIFDIPESYRHAREKIRLSLISLGFVMIQKSVWVYPYDCEDFIALLKADLKIGKKLLYLIVDDIENSRVLKESFGLEN